MMDYIFICKKCFLVIKSLTEANSFTVFYSTKDNYEKINGEHSQFFIPCEDVSVWMLNIIHTPLSILYKFSGHSSLPFLVPQDLVVSLGLPEIQTMQKQMALDLEQGYSQSYLSAILVYLCSWNVHVHILYCGRSFFIPPPKNGVFLFFVRNRLRPSLNPNFTNLYHHY